MRHGNSAALLALLVSSQLLFTRARIPDRERVVKARGEVSPAASHINRRVRHDGDAVVLEPKVAAAIQQQQDNEKKERFLRAMTEKESPLQQQRDLANSYTSCCSKYSSYDSNSLCSLYGYNCGSGGNGDNGKNNQGGSCTTSGLSFIGVSFSVNTAKGNAYTYQLCDQFPMENIIDRDYDYVMSMDEDGWLVGGGYKPFDYSGKMPYIDSSHTELLRIGNMNPANGYVICLCQRHTDFC